MKNYITIMLMLLCINVKAQTTVINADSSSNIIINNYGTVIENNQGTVNIGNESKSQDNYKSTGKSDGCSGSTVYTHTQTGFSNNENKCRNGQTCSNAECDQWNWNVGFSYAGIMCVILLFISLMSSEPRCVLCVGSMATFIISIITGAIFPNITVVIIGMILCLSGIAIKQIVYGDC